MKKRIIALFIICLLLPVIHAGDHRNIDISIFNKSLTLDWDYTFHDGIGVSDSNIQTKSDMEVSIFDAVVNGFPEEEERLSNAAEVAKTDPERGNMLNIIDYLDGNIVVRNETPYTSPELALAELSGTDPEPTPKNIVEKAIYENCPSIVCWGDSLTNGTGGYGVNYPDVLLKAINKNILGNDPYHTLYDNVINSGYSGEDAVTIAVRSGSVRLVTTEDFTIPDDDSSIEVKFRSAGNKIVTPLHKCKVYIDGVPGTLYSNNAKRITKETNVYYFKRSIEDKEDVSEVDIKAGTQIVFESSLRYRNSIPIIFMGQNGGYDSVDELITYQKAMIAHQTFDREKYIIVGLHSGTAVERRELETAMEEAFGNHYINLRHYMCTQALTDAGITPSAEDFEYMLKGMTPPTVLYGSVHFNDIGYELIGNLVYNRMVELGYFDEVRDAVSETIQNGMEAGLIEDYGALVDGDAGDSGDADVSDDADGSGSGDANVATGEDGSGDGADASVSSDGSGDADGSGSGDANVANGEDGSGDGADATDGSGDGSDDADGSGDADGAGSGNGSGDVDVSGDGSDDGSGSYDGSNDEKSSDKKDDEITGWDETFTLTINRASTIRAIIPEINKETDKSRMKLKIKGKAVSFKRMKLGDGYLVLHL
nr:hypothetical protein [Lachnospiraceae bacterium]